MQGPGLCVLETSLSLSGSQPYTCLANEPWEGLRSEESCGLGQGRRVEGRVSELVGCQSFPKASGLNSWGRQAHVWVHLDPALHLIPSLCGTSLHPLLPQDPDFGPAPHLTSDPT